jgi:hypothetical protein
VSKGLRLPRLFKPRTPEAGSRPSEPETEAADDLPTIPDNAGEDLPRDGAGAVEPAPPDPEGEHRRTMDGWKVKFAFWLISGCLIFAIVLTVAEEIFFRGEPSEFGGLVDLLKLVGTTALGFVFGRSLGQGEK